MTVKNRVSRLERDGSKNMTVMAFVPPGWSEEHEETALDGLAAEAGAARPFKYWITEEKGRIEPMIGFVGDIQDFFNEVARRSRRIGVASTTNIATPADQASPRGGADA